VNCSRSGQTPNNSLESCVYNFCPPALLFFLYEGNLLSATNSPAMATEMLRVTVSSVTFSEHV
jgi:hypothetical protein